MAECAVGLLNVSLGGSPIESWMDADALRAFPEALADLEPYLGDGVASKKSRDSVAERDRWYQALGYEAVADAHHEWLPLIAWDCPESKNIEPCDVACMTYACRDGTRIADLPVSAARLP